MPQTPITPTINNMADVWEAYRDELEGMERQARANLDSSVALVNTVAAHILNSGGKRIRPFLLLLSARLCGYAGRDHHQLASLVEFIHTASLLHDDVVDEADIRRGRRTARKVWGNQISILVGDYLYSKAFCQVVDFHNHGINEVLGEACKKMAEGEVLQLYYNGNPSMSETEYLKIVEHKTAGLIAPLVAWAPCSPTLQRSSRMPCSGSGFILASPSKWPTIPLTIRPMASIWASRWGRISAKARPRCRCCISSIIARTRTGR